jgi:hypothetical protein
VREKDKKRKNENGKAARSEEEGVVDLTKGRRWSHLGLELCNVVVEDTAPRLENVLKMEPHLTSYSITQ